MSQSPEANQTPAMRLAAPVPVRDQSWPEGTTPLVSISCVTYNHERFVRQALDSFLDQETTFPVELLLHDDASTDATASIVREYEAAYPQLVRPIYQVENQFSRGVRPNVTFNLSRVRGEYVALCEGDDYWTEPRKLLVQVGFLEANPEYAGSSHLTRVDDPSGGVTRTFGAGLPERVAVEQVIAPLAPFHTSSFVFRRDRMPWPFPAFHTRIASGDIGLFAYIAREGPIRHFSEVMSVYRRHPGGITNSPAHRSEFHQQRIKLMRYLRLYLGPEHAARVDEVIRIHQAAIPEASIVRRVWKRIVRALNRR